MFETETDGNHARRHHVVIVGGGVAGLELASRLGDDTELDVALVDAATTHVWKPMLHSIAAGTHDPAFAGVPYVAQARRHGFAYHPGAVRAVALNERAVRIAPFRLHGRTLLPERPLTYDTLVLAVGSVASDFGVPGVAEHSRHIDTLSEACGFRDDMTARLIAAASAGRRLSLAIVGGGATGVQLAAELLRMADIIDHFGLDGARAALSITLVDRADRLLLAFPEKIAVAARERLERLGIEVRTGVDVTEVTAEGLSLENGAFIAADLVAWAAGVEAAPLVRSLDALERGPAGRLAVEGDLRTTRRRDVFALGDCAAFVPPGSDDPLPTTAQVAHQQAAWLGRHLPRLIRGGKVPAFRYRDLGALVDLGGYDAYAALGKFGFFDGGFVRGRIAQAGHALLHRRHQVRLHGLRRAIGLWIADAISGEARPIERLR